MTSLELTLDFAHCSCSFGGVTITIKVPVTMMLDESQNPVRTWTFIPRNDKLKVIWKFNCPWLSAPLMKFHLTPHRSSLRA